MSSLDNIYERITPPPESAALTSLHRGNAPVENQAHMGRDVAHELNNIITIIRGYAERMVLKHGDNPALRPDLQLISDNARRAENVVRQATQHHRQPSRTVTA
ncbi:MAG TPA: histidine kinase dimerization/phospho-acceptor domain-containing protein [Verrucomicrobiae bacterium]